MRFMFGGEGRMLGKPALRFYKAVLRVGLLYGQVHTTPSMAGVAVWVGPDVTGFSLGILFRTGLLGALLGVGPGPLGRFVRSSAYVEKLQKSTISGPRWTLVYLAVDSAHRNRGIGGTLIDPGLARADAEGLPCYVESADERNLSFYARHGFSVVQQGLVPNGGPRVWTMLRQPARPGATA